MEKLFNDPNYETNIRVHLDACNSGSQFTSAITGDLGGCRATNVLPSYEPERREYKNLVRKDAYLMVSELSKQIVERELKVETDPEKIDNLKFYKKILLSDGRKICKRPVMVSNYGGTAGGRTAILWDMFRELKVERKYVNRRVATGLSNILGEAIGKEIDGVFTGTLRGGTAFEKYIHKMNNLIAQQNQKVYWRTADGFDVCHAKAKELKPKQIHLQLPGARRRTTIISKQFSKNKLNPRKMKSAISPNYIHSLDAMLLRRVSLGMKAVGILDCDMIHDSFGCNPNHVDKMLEITKNEFKRLVKEKPLEILHEDLSEQAEQHGAPQKKIDAVVVPNLYSLSENECMLDELDDSEWFFS
jgi:DNA-directed RNA polymerase